MRAALNYSNIAPTSILNKKKMAQWNPQGTYNNSLGSGDIVRFNIQTEDFWDPYSAYLEVTIDVSTNPNIADDANFTNKILQIDSSVSGLFNQQIISVKSEEVERIMHLDTLACILNDLNFDTNDRYSRDYEGFGGVYAPSVPNTVLTAEDVPRLNDGAYKFVKTWLPNQDMTVFLDSNTRTNALGGTGQTFTTRNHPIVNSQLSPFPVYNKAGVTFNAGTDATEWCNNFTFNTGAPGSSDPVINGPLAHYTPAFCGNGMEPYFSSTVTQRYMRNGYIKTDKMTSATFYIPILSGIFGALMHPSNYKLIPFKYLGEVVFEFQFNPHFLFTSWFSNNNANRNYTVKNLVLHASMVEVRDPQVLAQVEAEYQQGIRIPTQSFYLGPLQSIANGAVPPNIQFNLGFESLRNILFCFIPADYTANSSFRKQYRLSMGITSVQVKIGSDYYPSLAIKGNGGTNYGPVNNYQYVRYLFKAFGKHMKPQGTVINPHNFAVNCRANDPYSADPNLISDIQGCFYEENRVIGKAVYAVPLDALNYDNSLLSGINTSVARPFELLLGYDNSRVFTRNVNFVSFCHYDMVLYIGPDGVRALGKS